LDGYPVGPVVWLTPQSDGLNVRDVVIQRVGPDDGPEQYLIGYNQYDTVEYFVGIFDRSGTPLVDFEEVFIAAPVNNQRVWWPRREDAFKRDADGNITWVNAVSGTAKLHMFKFEL
jgi:hypothetical protein